MEVDIREYGRRINGDAFVIELTMKECGKIITVDAANLHGHVDEDFIQSLKDVVETLEEQNRMIEEEE